MKFEQYKMLKEHALAACAAAGAPFPATKEINPILLAYIGDVVFSMYVRLRLLPTSKHVRIVHDIGSKMVSAVCQCQAMQQLEAGRSEVQSTSNKYSAFQNWLDTFKETAATGDIYDPDNAVVMKAMVEYIVVHRDRMEIHLKCGVTIEKEYA